MEAVFCFVLQVLGPV